MLSKYMMVYVFLMMFLAIFLGNIYPITAEMQDIKCEIRSAAFYHSSNRFREIYGDVGVNYQLEASTCLNPCLDGWINLDWFSDDATIKECHARTKANIASVSFGLKYPYQFCDKFIGYIGVGPSISRIWLKNKNQCEHEKVSKLAFGCILKTGIYYFINCNVFIDFFADYLYQPVHFEKRVDIGGIKTGIGIGIQL